MADTAGGLGVVVSAVFRVVQRCVWTVRADTRDQLEDFLIRHGVDFLGPEDSIGEEIFDAPSEGYPGVELSEVLAGMGP